MTQLRGPGQLNSLEFVKITVMRGLAMPGKLHSALDLASPSRSVTACSARLLIEPRCELVVAHNGCSVYGLAGGFAAGAAIRVGDMNWWRPANGRSA